jgi:hypothetical protein
MLENIHLKSTSGREPLRIGIMLDSLTLSAWAASIVDHIQQSHFAGIQLLILNAAAAHGGPPPKPASLPIRLWRMLRDSRQRKQVLYNLYTRLDVKRYSGVDHPSRPVDCSGKLAGCKTISVVPIAKGFTHRFSPSDLEAIREYNLDVVLRFGFNIIRGEILKVPRFGIWSYHHGDNDYYRGGPPYFWELYERNALSGVILQVLSEDLDAGLVLCKANLQTHLGVSLSRNRVMPYWTASFFVIRKLHELHQYGWEHVVQRSGFSRLVAGRKPLYRTPTNTQMMRFLLSWAYRDFILMRVQRDRVVHWRVALRAGGEPLSLDHPDMRGFRWIESPKGHFFADPFLFERDGKTWLFFEDYSYREKRALIACAEVSSDGQISAPRPVLSPPYHLSYPFVFEQDGQVYMIPESGANNNVELYQADPFPERWRLVKALFSGVKAVDTTLWVENQTYWFFVTLVDPPAAGPQLFLFYSSSLTGQWTYHPDNPICSDVRFARGGGRIFCQNGRRIRPSQDHSRGYGSASHFREIVELTKDSYREVPLGSIQPNWEKGMIGTHTYNRCARIEAVDGKFNVPGRTHQ